MRLFIFGGEARRLLKNKILIRSLIFSGFFFYFLTLSGLAQKFWSEPATGKKDASKIGTAEGLQYKLGMIDYEEEEPQGPASSVEDEETQEDQTSETDLGGWDHRKRKQRDKGDEKGRGTVLDANVIQPGDMLDIVIYPQENLSSSRYVDNNGYIFFPYVGEIKATGMTVNDFERNLTSILEKDYLEHPRIFIRKEASALERWREPWRDAYVKPILIYGEGRATAYYPTREKVTLLEVLSHRGGISPPEDIDRIQVTRNVNGRLIIFFVNVGDMIEGKKPDLRLRPGDLLLVTQGGASVYVLGEVNRPGPIHTHLFGYQQTLIRALSLAGGFTRIAAKNRVRIVRVVNGREVRINVNAGKILKGQEKDVVLKEGDIVVVPEAFW